MTRGAFGKCKNRIGSLLPKKERYVKFNCSRCGALLVKYDIKEDKVVYKREGLYEEGNRNGNCVKVLCPEDHVWNAITKTGCVFLGEDK